MHKGPTTKNSFQESREFWHKKKVLITGHTGFKGSWLTLWLRSLGADVYGISLPPQDGRLNLFELAEIKSDCKSYFSDIRDFDSLSVLIDSIQPENIFHLAAQTLVRQSYMNPLETYGTNLMGTVNLLECLRQVSSVKSVVMVTTDKVYKNMEWLWPYRENDLLGGHDPYSASKAASEIIVESYKNAFFNGLNIPIATARAGNVIGGGDWAVDRLLPDAMRAWAAGSMLEIRSPDSIRPWQHVLDPLYGYMILGMNLSNSSEFNGAFNFGPDSRSSATVKNVIEIARKYYEHGNRLVNYLNINNGPHEARQLTLDVSKTTSILSINPRWELEESIRRTVQWYSNQLSGKSARNLCLQEIWDFENHE